MKFLHVYLRTNEYSRGPVDQVELVGYDLHLRCDIVSERDVLLARAMADNLGIELHDLRAGHRSTT